MAKLINAVSLSLAACFALSASSCSLAFNLGDDQCDKTSDCTARGFPASAACVNKICVDMSTTGSSSSASSSGASSSSGAGGALPAGWECLGNVKPADPMGNPVMQQFLFKDALSNANVTTIKAKLCGPLDVSCSTPFLSGLTPDGMGNLTVTPPLTPSGFYLDIVDNGTSTSSSSSSSSSTGTGGGTGMCCDNASPQNCTPEPGPAPAYRHTLAYVGSSNGAPLVIPPTLKKIRAVTNDGLCSLANALTIHEDPTRGSVIILTPNCNDIREGNPGPPDGSGVVVEASTADAQTVPLYFKGGFPKKVSATVFDTDDEGAAAFINLPVGSTTITTHLWNASCQAAPATCPKIGSATILIRPSTLTYVFVGPSSQ